MGFQESLWKGMTIELRAEFCPPPQNLEAEYIELREQQVQKS